MLFGADLFGNPAKENRPCKLADDFIVPPFSVLSARDGNWQDRKRRWLSFGIKSEVGRAAGQGMNTHAPTITQNEDGTLNYSGTPGTAERFDRQRGDGKPLASGKDAGRDPGRCFGQDLMRGEHVMAATAVSQKLAPGGGGCWLGGPKTESSDNFNGAGEQKSSGTSIFDPVVCELTYKWFCPAGGQIVDPFAGGSVRGIVADLLGFKYWGCDLRAEQIAANRQQGEAICGESSGARIDRVGAVFVFRGDLWRIGGAIGGKAKTCWHLVQGAKGLVTAGSRSSPQANIVAQIAKHLGVPCRVHTSNGKLSDELILARSAGAEVVQHVAGYNNVICSRAKADAALSGMTYIPFGMECEEAVVQTSADVDMVPVDTRRIVIPVGSGMSLCGVLWGLYNTRRTIPVIGVCVGADPVKRMDAYAPPNWREMCTLVTPGSSYHNPAERCHIGNIRLDSFYEAKCIPFLEDGDLLWVVGIRQSEDAGDAPGSGPVWECGDSMATPHSAPAADFIFSCPPYGDLEQYSDDPRDISTMDYHSFIAAYRRIILRACERLKQDRFACFVVGDFRNPKTGCYRNFVSDTIESFRQCGLELYNEAVLVTAVGSLPIRVGRQFTAGRKLGKTH